MPNANFADDALNKYRVLKEKIGHVPSSREFFNVFPKRKLGIAFEGGNAYSKLQQLAGDTPHEFSSPKSSLDKILLQWGSLARSTIQRFKKLPIQDDWVRSDLKPTVSGIEKSHKVRWSDLPRLFSERFENSGDWCDVMDEIPTSETECLDTDQLTENEECYVYLMKDLRNGARKIGISVNPCVKAPCKANSQRLN